MKKDNVLNLIKKRNTIRKYQKITLPKEVIDKIVQAGWWASSIHGFQPWRFVIVSDKEIIKKISNIFRDKASLIRGKMDKLMDFSATTIRQAPLIVLAYNSKEFVAISERFFKIKKRYVGISKLTEVEAVSAAIQNMIIVAASNGLGSCWITTALFCEEEINRLLSREDQLLAIITFGYPFEKTRRTPRKKISKIVQYIN